jgi:hypothetical protein
LLIGIWRLSREAFLRTLLSRVAWLPGNLF